MASIPNSPRQQSLSFSDVLSGFLLQPGLPFSSILSPQLIELIFRRHGCLFGGIYTTSVVVWAFLSQVLRDGKEASCQSAVARIGSHLKLLGQSCPTADTGDYCRARAKLSEQALAQLCREVGSQAQQHAKPNWLWKGRHTKLVDGFTFLMPDTFENQQEYPQHSAQKPGLGFPIARVAAILSLATGCILDAALGPFKGKGTGETALFRTLLGSLNRGDVVVADRYFCNYWMVALLMGIGVDICFRNHQNRHTDFRRGRRLGKNDHLTNWRRPPRPSWMTVEMYQTMPLSLELREMKYTVNVPGRKQDPFVIITTMTEIQGDQAVRSEDIAELFQFRWNVELDIRSIKSNMNLHHVRCKSPEMVRREFWTTLLAYSLIRTTAAAAAALHDRQPRQISFVSTCQYVLAAWQVLTSKPSSEQIRFYCEHLLKQIASCIVGNRPGRIEPRVIKKRRNNYNLMLQPRRQLQRRLAKHDNSFE